MGLFAGLWLLLLGVLGAANLIIAQKPDAKELIGKISPYQGWIGAMSVLGGAWWLVYSLLSLGWIAYAPILWATLLGTAVVQIILGLLLGVGVIKTFVSQPEAVARMDQMVTRMAPKQGLFGLISIGLGLWMIVASFLWAVR